MSILFDEINEQPQVLSDLIELETENILRVIQSIKNKFSNIIIAARGSSDNAARYAQYLFGIQNRIQVALATPSLFTLYNTAPRMKDALVIGISQSGQSPDIVSVLSEASKQGCPTIAVTNNIKSPLAKASDFIVDLHSGEEKAIAATKTYTASLCALALMSISLNGNPDNLTILKKIPSLVSETLNNSTGNLNHIERYRYADHFCVIGRGYNYATAFEISLKIKELNKIVAEPYSSADFRHGPIATIQKDFPVILISPKDCVYHDLMNLLSDLRVKGAEVIMISDTEDHSSEVNLMFKLPTGIPEWLKPILAVIPGQLFSYRLASEKGLDPDNPPGLKKVTQTT
jgi:glucosamine--fructose-6-phosphate aminotransferase (isomerizing)